jgi:hypothetical protein
VAGAAFGGLAAAVLRLSVAIAATVSGVLLAVMVGYFVYRYPPPPRNMNSYSISTVARASGMKSPPSRIMSGETVDKRGGLPTGEMAEDHLAEG